jgi:hypothetical protein
MTGQVYFIQPEVLLGTDRFKVGKHDKNGLERIKSYGKKTEIIIVWECQNSNFLEFQIIKKFKENFKLIKGNEYFQGDKQKMKKLFMYIIYNNNDNNNIIDLKHFRIEKKKEINENKLRNPDEQYQTDACIWRNLHNSINCFLLDYMQNIQSIYNKLEEENKILKIQRKDLYKEYTKYCITNNFKAITKGNWLRIIKSWYTYSFDFVRIKGYDHYKINLTKLRETLSPPEINHSLIKRENELNDQMKVDAKMSTLNEFIKKYHGKIPYIIEKYHDCGGNDNKSN